MSDADEADERVASRANLLPEEARTGSDDPEGQAEAILAESDERVESREAEAEAEPAAPEAD